MMLRWARYRIVPSAKKRRNKNPLRLDFRIVDFDTLPTPACEPLQERTAVVGLPKVISGPLDSAVVCATP